jgi:hypothetical protein
MGNETLENSVSDRSENSVREPLSFRDAFLGVMLTGSTYMVTHMAYAVGEVIALKGAEELGSIGSEIVKYGLPGLAFLGMSTIIGASVRAGSRHSSSGQNYESEFLEIGNERT